MEDPRECPKKFRNVYLIIDSPGDSFGASSFGNVSGSNIPSITSGLKFSSSVSPAWIGSGVVERRDLRWKYFEAQRR